ncbi:MAG: hypothetical protein IAG13_32000, partial [Deltaproteobacteria bacterium]|nr:hypothetical protein [Nannocystaceae bacterium]
RSRWSLDDEGWVRRARASVPLLVADGWLARGAWAQLLAQGPVFELGKRTALWTGLLARIGEGRVLWIGDAGNRRNRDVGVDAVTMLGGSAWVPVVLELEPRARLDHIELVGELACLAEIDAALPQRIATLGEHPSIAEAHLAFYDAAYFAEKREGATKKYRRLLAERSPEHSTDALVAVAFGPRTVALEPCARTHAAEGPRSGSPALQLVFRNLIEFRARYDGLRVHIDVDPGELARAAAVLETDWTDALGSARIGEHRGALWYLTKYFTPHVAGEPHFFVKPWALCATPPGISLLVDGCHGEGYDVLRGVVRSDRFGATPAVFGLWGSGAAIEVPAGRVLTRMLPFAHDRQLLAPRWQPPLPTAAVPR